MFYFLIYKSLLSNTFSHIFQKIHDETIIDIFSTRTPRRKKTKNVRFGQIGSKFIIHI